MKLVDNQSLEKSAVVANNAMNRERNLQGVNSYLKDLKINIIDFLLNVESIDAPVRWMDLCCGSAKALIQAAQLFEERYSKIPIELQGLDLVDFFDPLPSNLKNLHLQVASVPDWNPQEKYDLISCVHGLHYLGDKLAVIQKCCAYLKPKGLFRANLDLNNIKIEGIDNTQKFLKNLFQKNKINFQSTQKIITCEGFREIDFFLEYQGADDQAGANYTGQPSVDAYYSLKNSP